MKIQYGLVGTALALAVSSVAFAQSNDAAYCNALGTSFDKYVDSNGGRGGRQITPANVAIAKGKCQSDPASAIPVLEGALKDAKIPLPSRS